MAYTKTLFLLFLVVLILAPQAVDAFGAGNIASIAKIEGQNWRHGDIEDTLKTVAGLKGHKWTSMMIKRVYFGNWLRDYSQAVDVGTLTKVQAGSIRILVWILAFMSFGYATGEFEVTDERLGCYRPEEHIDNPKDYADNQDARKYDQRLRGPVRKEELEIDPRTGMKNYIANERGDWATSAGYVRYSFARSIHYGRLYTHGNNKGREEDLCEALRCLGQGLHCLEDFGAHTQYVELALRELGFHNVFAHVGSGTEIELRGKRVFPLVTGTFGGVDFLHSVIGEASDHVTQSEVDDMNQALGNAQAGQRSADGNSSDLGDLTGLLGMIPGAGDLARQAEELQRDADSQAAYNNGGGNYSNTRGGFDDDNYSSDRAFNPMSMLGGSGMSGAAGAVPTDPQEIIKKIYPILQFRDNVVRTIDKIISKIPGLETIVEKITETVTLFVMRLLAPYVMPLIATASQGLKQGSGAVIHSSTEQQYLVFDDPHSSDPTHSMLSKDHFSNILNEPAGKVATEILKFAAPRVIYAWDHPEVPEQQVLDDVVHVFHHPAIRDMNNEVHRNMFNVVEHWIRSKPNGGRDIENMLTSQSVRNGKNHKAEKFPEGGIPNPFGGPGAVLGGGQRSVVEDEPVNAGYPGASASHAHASQNFAGSGYGNTSNTYDAPSGPPSSHNRPYGGNNDNEFNAPSGPLPGYGHRPGGGNNDEYDAPSGPPPGHGGSYGSSAYDAPQGPPPGHGGPPPFGGQAGYGQGGYGQGPPPGNFGGGGYGQGPYAPPGGFPQGPGYGEQQGWQQGGGYQGPPGGYGGPPGPYGGQQGGYGGPPGGYDGPPYGGGSYQGGRY